MTACLLGLRGPAEFAFLCSNHGSLQQGNIQSWGIEGREGGGGWEGMGG